MEIALKEIETQIAVIYQHLENIEISDNPNYDFEDKLRANLDYLESKKAELLGAHKPLTTATGDSDLPDDIDISPVVERNISSFSSLSSKKDPLRSVYNIPKQGIKKPRSISTSSARCSPVDIFKKNPNRSRPNSPAAVRYSPKGIDFTDESLGRTEIFQGHMLTKGKDLANPFAKNDDLVEIGRVSNASEPAPVNLMPPRYKRPRAATVIEPRTSGKTDAEGEDFSLLDSKQKNLLESLSGVGPKNMQKIIGAVAKNK